MSEVDLNPTIDGYRGAIGKLVFKKYKGRTIVCRKPKFTKPPSPRQIAQRQRFKEAVAYAKSVLADPVARTFYEPIAKERDTSVYWLAIKEFLTQPSLKTVDLSNPKGKISEQFLATTHDDIDAVNVKIEPARVDEMKMDHNKAVELGTVCGYWTYIATVAAAAGTDIFIETEALDRPGSRTVVSTNPIVGS